MPQAGLTGSSQVQQSIQYSSLEDYLLDKKELVSALDAFCKPAEDEYTSSADTEEVQEHLAISWQAVISHAAQVSFKDEKQQKLVQFISKLQQRRALQKDSQTCQIQEMTVWQDLPTFGWSLRDAWNLAADGSSDKDSQQHWINLNAFTATLLGSTYPQAGDSLGLSLFCIWTVRQALEESQAASDVAVAAASSWFVFAAPTIKKLCEQQKSFDGKIAKPGSAFANAEWTGFSTDRWQAWTSKLAEVENQVSDSTAGELVKQARTAVSE